jgi:hypothetical protein
MALPVTIPYTFGTATSAIPLSQLDSDFSTVATALNGVSDGTSSLANVNIIGGNISGLANPITVGNGGTGLNTLTANSLMVGNGNSAVQFLAPGTTGNIVYSNGTGWTSTAFIPQPGAAGNVVYSNGTAWISQSGLALPSQTGLSGTVLKTNGSTTSWATALNLGTAVAPTSGTAVLFTSIPSWVKRVSLMLYGVQTSGSSTLQVQLGSGSIQTTGYQSSGAKWDNAGGGYGGSSTTSLLIDFNSAASTFVRNTIATFDNVSGNLWVMTTMTSYGTSALNIAFGAGRVTLSGSLDRLQLAPTNGTDTFTAGTINISWE